MTVADELRGGLLVMSGEFPPAPGGIGIHSYEIVSGLHRLGVPVRVLCPMGRANKENVCAFDRALPFSVMRYAADAKNHVGVFLRTLQVMRWVSAQKPRCLLSSGRRPTWIMSRVARSTKLPFFVIGHGSEFQDREPRRLQRTVRALQEARGIAVHSRFTARLVARLGVLPEKVRVISPGADSSRTMPSDAAVRALKRGIGLTGRRVILTVGRVCDRKAQDVVIRAMPDILKVVPDALYLVVGIPDRKEKYIALARELGVADKLIFYGVAPSEELPLLYAACDLFIMSSRITESGECEGFGMALVEAGLFGRPVIGTRGSGIEEAVEDGVTGLLIDQNSPEQAARTAIQILTNPDQARRMGENGRKNATERFTWERATKELYEMLQPCLG